MTQGRNSMIGHSRSKLQSRPTLACDKRRFFSGPWMKTFVLGSHRKALRIFWNAESVQQQLRAGYIAVALQYAIIRPIDFELRHNRQNQPP